MPRSVNIDYEPDNFPPGSVVITAPLLIAYGEPATNTNEASPVDSEEN